MTQVYIPSWGVKDPDDTRAKSFDAAGTLAANGNPTITSFSVFVAGILAENGSIPASGLLTPDDGALVITNVAWNPTLKRISFRWSGGTLGRWYLVTCRISGADFSADQSAKVFIGHK